MCNIALLFTFNIRRVPLGVDTLSMPIGNFNVKGKIQGTCTKLDK